MTDIDIDASELDDVQDNILLLGGNLWEDAKELQQSEPSQMRRFIQQSVDRNFGTDGSGWLRASFNVKSSGNAKIITTTGNDVDYAMALEKGIDPHIIESDHGPLKFTPADQSKYPPSSRQSDGSVILDKVEWKPRNPQTATGYDYVYAGQLEWDSKFGPPLRAKINNSIREAGFR